jgi:hypothetical protein
VTTVFADTVYWVAVVRPNDPWAASANRARQLLRVARLVTTDEILIEFLTALAGAGERPRMPSGWVRLTACNLVSIGRSGVSSIRAGMMNSCHRYSSARRANLISLLT